ncbi:hypothetical protein [Cytobacillus sp. FSL H8-0458]|uniref:hypothetical protein n=1 Tax=Cytobacillus sp. FSL H8-0458 TaxID=2975346 RepID=UPI0030F62135
MSATIEAVKGGKVFGEIKVNTVANQDVSNLHEEIVLRMKELTLSNKADESISVQVHDLFLEQNNSTQPNQLSATFVVSIHVESDTERSALQEANLQLNESVVNFFQFQLEDYYQEVYNFNVIDFEIDWNEFLNSDQI